MKLKNKQSTASLTIYARKEGNIQLQFVSEGIAAGFPSPAIDFKEDKISLDKELAKNPASTYYARVRGESMIGAGLAHNDIVVIDKSLPATNGKIAVCYVDGEFTIKRLKIEKECIYLMPENDRYQPIKIEGEQQLYVWGIITHVVKEI